MNNETTNTNTTNKNTKEKNLQNDIEFDFALCHGG